MCELFAIFPFCVCAFVVIMCMVLQVSLQHRFALELINVSNDRLGLRTNTILMFLQF